MHNFALKLSLFLFIFTKPLHAAYLRYVELDLPRETSIELYQRLKVYDFGTFRCLPENCRYESTQPERELLIINEGRPVFYGDLGKRIYEALDVPEVAAPVADRLVVRESGEFQHQRGTLFRLAEVDSQRDFKKNVQNVFISKEKIVSDFSCIHTTVEFYQRSIDRGPRPNEDYYSCTLISPEKKKYGAIVGNYILELEGMANSYIGHTLADAHLAQTKKGDGNFFTILPPDPARKGIMSMGSIKTLWEAKVDNPQRSLDFIFATYIEGKGNNLIIPGQLQMGDHINTIHRQRGMIYGEPAKKIFYEIGQFNKNRLIKGDIKPKTYRELMGEGPLIVLSHRDYPMYAVHEADIPGNADVIVRSFTGELFATKARYPESGDQDFYTVYDNAYGIKEFAALPKREFKKHHRVNIGQWVEDVQSGRTQGQNFPGSID